MDTSIINAAWPFIIMALLFYFMLYRPQKKQQNQRSTMLNSLKVGTKIVTIGGIYGEITKITDDKISVKIADNVEIKILRSAVGNLQNLSALEAAKTTKADKAAEAAKEKTEEKVEEKAEEKAEKVEEKAEEAAKDAAGTEQKNG